MFNFVRKQQHNQAMNSLNQPVILVVDDIATNVTFMKALLKGKNYEVIDAYSGIDFLCRQTCREGTQQSCNPNRNP